MENKDKYVIQGCWMLTLILWLYIGTIIWIIVDSQNRMMSIAFFAGLLTKPAVDWVVALMSRTSGFESSCPDCHVPIIKIDNYCRQCGKELDDD